MWSTQSRAGDMHPPRSTFDGIRFPKTPSQPWNTHAESPADARAACIVCLLPAVSKWHGVHSHWSGWALHKMGRCGCANQAAGEDCQPEETAETRISHPNAHALSRILYTNSTPSAFDLLSLFLSHPTFWGRRFFVSWRLLFSYALLPEALGIALSLLRDGMKRNRSERVKLL
jgi:hypothetical protein